MSTTDPEKSCWKSLRDFYEDNFSKRSDDFKWIFRGETFPRKDRESRSISDLQTSLDKVFDSFRPDNSDGSGKCYKRLDLEMSLLREFQRKAHHHLSRVPKDENTLEWLTFMQHYGGPTRLLDWTYSFYVAVFFAVARLDWRKEYGEVWIANAKWLDKGAENFCTNRELVELKQNREKDAIHMDEFHNAILDELFRESEPLVVLLNAFHLNDRLVVQQGTFLVQGDIDKSFGENLSEMGRSQQLQNNLHRIVIDVDDKRRNKILKELNNMNINNATLFPGLQGFAESLATQLAYPEKLGIDRK